MKYFNIKKWMSKLNFDCYAVVIFLVATLLFINCSHQAPRRNISRSFTLTERKTKKYNTPEVNTSKKQPASAETKITMNFQDARLVDVLRVIASEFKVNIIIPHDEKSRVTAYLYHANITDALDMILSNLDYTYINKNGTFFIMKKDEIVSRVYRLKYTSAPEIQKVLEGMSGTGNVKADNITNSLVITDVVANIKTYDEIIQSLDLFQPSVLIEAEIFEVSLDNIQNLGIEWGADYEENGHQFQLQTPFSADATSLILNYSKLNAPQIQLLLNALRKNTESHLLSSPRIVTMNGEEAKILVGERVPYVRSSTATSTGNVLQEVEFVDVGILLKVTPRILPEERLVFIDISPEVSEVLNMEVQGVPRIGTREARTRVAVKDGETIIIGGLIKEGRVTSESIFPLLGKIPLLNLLFKNSNKTHSKRELIVFITPYILTEDDYKKMGTELQKLRMNDR